MEQAEIVIVGGGLAGAAAAESYRKAGGAGSITIISRDAAPPVHRPPLSKEFLRGDQEREQVFVHPAAFYEENGITLLLGTGVSSLDLPARQVVLDGGARYGYETLVLATGARPRRLGVPGSDLAGIHYLRSLESSERLRAAAGEARTAVIIGAGFIGMEVAASLTTRGVRCTVVEPAPRMWSRIAPEVVSAFIQGYYRDRGVDFRFGTGVQGIEGDGAARAVLLETGERLPADLVVIGIGAALNTQLAERAGLEVEQGVEVDAFFRTSQQRASGAPADVYAIGDIARFPDPIGGRMHAEHWDNALQQGRSLGNTLAGQGEPYQHVAYFFSDLFDLSLNMIGYPADWDDIILRGDPGDGRFTVIYVKDEAVRAVLMINDDRHFGAWPALVRERRSVVNVAARLADPAVDPPELSGEVAGIG